MTSANRRGSSGNAVPALERNTKPSSNSRMSPVCRKLAAALSRTPASKVCRKTTRSLLMGFCSVRCLGCSRDRSEEHTSELQSQSNLVCRLLLEKKKKEQPQRRHPL